MKVNSKHFVDIDNIKKLVEKKHPKCASCRKVWIYLKEGYPKIIKAQGSKRDFLKKLLLYGLTNERYKELRDKK